MSDKEHYLAKELSFLVKTNNKIFDFLQHSTLDGLWYWDLEKPEIEWMNDHFWNLLGHDPKTKKHLAAEWQDLIHPDDLATSIENFNAHLKDPNHPYDQIVRYQHKDGSTVWVRCRGMIIRNDEGTPLRMIGAHNDLTGLMLTQQRLEQQTESLKREVSLRQESDLANKAKDHFFAKMSHELRTPLNAVIGFSEALLLGICGAQNEKQTEYIENIRNSGTHLLALVNDILDLAKIESNEEKLSEEVIDIPSVMNNCLHCIASIANQKEVTLTVDILNEIPNLYGDERRINQIFTNLLSNAIKFSPKGESVSFSAQHSAAGSIIIVVRDHGSGIAADNIKHLTKPFHQIRGDIHSTPLEGTGLGLSISNSLTLLHGGILTIESQIEKGTTVRVCFPPERTISATLERPRFVEQSVGKAM
ncbi:PAS domain-containing sensor histidine kinase [Kiloniella antarctica]|uniref:histidine kinase n=1 Tax=Kiloniella antarctica TaxID=1550907 RepID=A0ABW5BLW6_9PROT